MKHSPSLVLTGRLAWAGLIAAALVMLLLQGRALLSLPVLLLLSGFVLAWLSDGRPLFDPRGLLFRFQPLTLGLLIPLMRIFYWDWFDWQARLDWLMLALALIYWGRLCRQRSLPRAFLRFFGSLGAFRRGLTVFFICYIPFAAATLLFRQQQVPFSGDEPHYLVIAQSLARDGDLNVANQYYQRQYRSYLDVDRLGIHGYFGKRGQNEIYSMHLPGVALSVTPLLWLIPEGEGIVTAIRLLLSAYGALLFVMIYLSLWRILGQSRLSLVITLVMAWSAPLFFHAFHFYPETQVALLLISSLYLRFLSPRRRQAWVLVLSGLLLGLLLFWGVKYAILLYLYGFGALFSLLKQREWRSALLWISGALIMQGLFWAYLYSAYGNFSPGSVYMNSVQKGQFWDLITRQVGFGMRLETFCNYFLDQRDGLLLYAPLYLFALAGFFALIARVRRYRRLFWFVLPAIVYIGSYAFMTHRGGHCPQARPLAPVSWALMLLVLFWFRHSGQRWLKRRLLPGLMGYGFFMTALQIFHPYSLYQSTTHDVQFRPGLIFQSLGNAYIELSRFLPSFIKSEGNWAWLPNLLFPLLLLLITLLALYRRKRISPALPRGMWLIPWLLVLVLFPRFPLFNPVLVDRSDLLPHQIYGASLYPRRAEGRSLRLGGRQRIPILLAPVFPLTGLDLRLNNAAPEAQTVGVWSFDRKIWSGVIPGGTERIVPLQGYELRRWRGKDLLQLHVVAAGGRPDMEIEALPRGRRPVEF